MDEMPYLTICAPKQTKFDGCCNRIDMHGVPCVGLTANKSPRLPVAQACPELMDRRVRQEGGSPVDE
jgi:hypothetical protein